MIISKRFISMPNEMSIAGSGTRSVIDAILTMIRRVQAAAVSHPQLSQALLTHTEEVIKPHIDLTLNLYVKKEDQIGSSMVLGEAEGTEFHGFAFGGSVPSSENFGLFVERSTITKILYHNAFVSTPFSMTLTLKNDDHEQDIVIDENIQIINLNFPVEGIVELRLKSLEGELSDEVRHRITMYLSKASS
jgi:hypothetical protein